MTISGLHLRRVLLFAAILAGAWSLGPASIAAQTEGVVRLLAGRGLNDAYGTGVGGSAGIEFPFIRDRQFFLGLRGVYHFGSDGTLDGFGVQDAPDPIGEVSQMQGGIEIGTTWMSEPLLIRTVGGIGLSRVDVAVETGSSELEGTNNKLTYGPGLLLAVPTDRGRFFGVEIRWLKVSDLDSTLALYGTIGARHFGS